MDMNSGVNPSQGGPLRAELNVQSETVSYTRVAPPPYSPTDPALSTRPPVTNQPAIIHQTIIIRGSLLKEKPSYFDCPACGKSVLTEVKYVNTSKTHMTAGFICGFSMWCMMCCFAALPYLLPTFKKAEHYCPDCHKFLGSYSRF